MIVSIYSNVYVAAINAQYYFNCWKVLKLFKLQHNILRGYRCESRENKKN